MGTGLGGLIRQKLAVFQHDRPARSSSLVQRERELLVFPSLVLQGKAVRAVAVLTETVGRGVNLHGGELLAIGGKADLGGVVDEVEVSADGVFDRRASSDLVHKLCLELVKIGVEFAVVGVPGEVLQEDLAVKVGGVLVIDVHVVAGVDHRLEGVVRAPERDVDVARRGNVERDGVRGAGIGC